MCLGILLRSCPPAASITGRVVGLASAGIRAPPSVARVLEQGTCDYDQFFSEKAVWSGLIEYAPPVAQLMQYLRLEAKITLAIKDSMERNKLGVVSAVCEWLKNNENEPTWSAWLPPQRYWVQCELGYKTIVEEGKLPTCEPCPAGSFSKEPYGTACTVCEPGFFAHTSGMASCVSCDANGDQYQDMPNRTSCVACPSNTSRYIGIGSAKEASACQCKVGTAIWATLARTICIRLLPYLSADTGWLGFQGTMHRRCGTRV
jgi:hypothetical protein